jgi:cell division protein FtsZ
MAAPLKPTVSIEDQAAAEPAPAAEEPAVAARTEGEEPTLFEGLDAQRAAAQEQMEDIFEEEAPAAASAENDLPPPAYRPEVAEFQPSEVESYEDQTDSFVAPKAPAPGTPSPEALARLRAAAGRTQEPEAAAETQRSGDTDKSRFGINSLINRMTGHGETQAQPRQQPPVRSQQAEAQPQSRAEPEPEPDPDQERIEIPAFLRRQAN